MKCGRDVLNDVCNLYQGLIVKVRDDVAASVMFFLENCLYGFQMLVIRVRESGHGENV